MPLCLTTEIDAIAAAVSGRPTSLFAPDLDGIGERIAGRRVLVAGGAGSIGSATILALLGHQPATLAVLDPSENNLAELVRSIRSQDPPWRGDLNVQPLAYGSPLGRGWIARQPRFDLVLSFAALKHVRSERDEWSLARMLDVNLIEADRFLAALRHHGHGQQGVFFVSTDKAADPASLMGASKRAMELLLWAHASDSAPASLLDGGQAPALARVTTTRFANVAFSDGSLPWAFLQRLAKGQPLAAPGDIRRYLVSPRESGDLCLLAALRCPHRHLLVPRLDPAKHQVTFTAVAEATLRSRGLVPAWYDDEAAARGAVERERAQGRWPVLVTSSNTSGEKSEEIFVGAGETALDIGLASAQAVAGAEPPLLALGRFLGLIDSALRRGDPPPKAELATALAAVVPGLHHRETGLSLDAKL